MQLISFNQAMEAALYEEVDVARCGWPSGRFVRATGLSADWELHETGQPHSSWQPTAEDKAAQDWTCLGSSAADDDELEQTIDNQNLDANSPVVVAAVLILLGLLLTALLVKMGVAHHWWVWVREHLR